MRLACVIRVATYASAPIIVLAADANLEFLRETGRWKQIRAVVESKHRGNPNDAQNLAWMSRVKQVFGDAKGAYDLAQKAVAADPRNADCQCALGEAAGLMAQKAGLLKKYSYAKECKKAGEAALAIDPKHKDALGLMIAFHTQAPGIVGGDAKRAEELRKTLLSLDPVQSCIWEVNKAAQKKDLGQAERLLLKALAEHPKSYALQMGMANLCLDPTNKKAWEAVKHARNALALDPKRTGAYTVLAVAYADLGQWKELDTLLAQAEQNIPDDRMPVYAAGRTLVTLDKELARAEQCFKAYLGREPEGGTPDHAAAHWRLGQVYEKQGRKGEAITELETALRFRPDFDQAKQDLKRLK